MTIIDETKLNEFVGRVLGDLGGAMSVPLVRMGEALGLYKKLGEIGPASAEDLTAATGCSLRYIQEWLSHRQPRAMSLSRRDASLLGFVKQ